MDGYKSQFWTNLTRPISRGRRGRPGEKEAYLLIARVDKRSSVPAYRQICDEVARLVDDRTLAAGERLPPTRVLARRLGLHRSTVVRAYAELWALGYLESRPGSYSTVRARPGVLTRGRPRRPPGAIDWDAVATAPARRANDTIRALTSARAPSSHPSLIDLSELAPDGALAPHRELGRCFRAVLRREGRTLFDYGEPAGYGPLREVVARRLRTHGIDASAGEVMITSGAQQAIDLALRLLVRPGDRIAVESPTYATALALFRAHDLRLLEVPIRPHGMDLDVLAAASGRRPPALVYTIPNFQNPTGITTSQPHRERLLELCRSRRIPILEDGFEEELKYFGKTVLPIKSMDAHGLVLYVGTFSKVLFPGLRIGWLVAPPRCLERLLALQRACSIAGNGVSQAAMARFCERGFYEAHLRRMHTTYRRRMQALLQALSTHMPPGVEWTEPAGGYTLWLRIAGLDERVLHRRLLDDGVRLAPGAPFFASPAPGAHFRLSVCLADEDQIVEACRRMGRSLAQGAQR